MSALSFPSQFSFWTCFLADYVYHLSIQFCLKSVTSSIWSVRLHELTSLSGRSRPQVCLFCGLFLRLPVTSRGVTSHLLGLPLFQALFSFTNADYVCFMMTPRVFTRAFLSVFGRVFSFFLTTYPESPDGFWLSCTSPVSASTLYLLN